MRCARATGNDITARYPELARLNRALQQHEAMLDGEIVAFDAEGRPSFEALQRRMHVQPAGAVTAARQAERRSAYVSSTCCGSTATR